MSASYDLIAAWTDSGIRDQPCATRWEAFRAGWEAALQPGADASSPAEGRAATATPHEPFPTPIDLEGGSSGANPSAGSQATSAIGDAEPSGASDWTCRSCGAAFVSAGGKIVGGTCPRGRPTCPLEPAA